MLSRQDIDYDALVKEDRVHISLYTDPSVFTEEMDKIFHRGWVYVGHQGEVPNPGDFRLKRIGLQPVIMCEISMARFNCSSIAVVIAGRQFAKRSRVTHAPSVACITAGPIT